MNLVTSHAAARHPGTPCSTSAACRSAFRPAPTARSRSGRQPAHRSRRNAVHRGRKRLRQVHDRQRRHGLLPQPMVAPVAGAIVFQGHDLLALAEPHGARGNRIGMIFQDPMSALNPVMRIGDQLESGAPAPVARRQARPHPGRAARRAAAGSRGHRRQLSRTPVRRPAPARHDRLRADAGAGAADRRRAHHRAGRHHPGADPGADPRSAHRVPGPRPAGLAAMARAARQPHRHDLPGSDVGAQSGDAHRRPARRGAGRAPALSPADKRARILGALRDARLPDPEGIAASYPGRLSGGQRQRHDRLRADAGAGAADRRRAHHRAGRHHPGADPGADPRSAGQARHRAVHHA